MHYKSLRCESICENHQSLQSPRAVDFSYVTYFQMLLIFWHIKDVQRVSSLKSIIKRHAAPIPPVAMETAHYREAGMCCRGAGCHGDRYGDLHKWSERALNPHDKFSASRSRSDGIKTMSVGAADEDIRVPPTFPSAKVGIVSLAIKRWLTVVEQMPGGPKVTLQITHTFFQPLPFLPPLSIVRMTILNSTTQPVLQSNYSSAANAHLLMLTTHHLKPCFLGSNTEMTPNKWAIWEHTTLKK